MKREAFGSSHVSRFHVSGDQRLILGEGVPDFILARRDASHAAGGLDALEFSVLLKAPPHFSRRPVDLDCDALFFIDARCCGR